MLPLILVAVLSLLPSLAAAESKILVICESKTYQVTVSVTADADHQDQLVVVLDNGITARTFSRWIDTGQARETLERGMNLANAYQQLDPLFLKITKTSGRIAYGNTHESLRCDAL